MDGTDCSTVRNATAVSRGGFVSRLMMVLLGNTGFSISGTNKTVSNDCLRVNEFDFRKERNTFPVPSLLDQVDHDQHCKVVTAIKEMVQTAVENGFPRNKLPKYRKAVADHTYIIRVPFLYGLPAN